MDEEGRARRVNNTTTGNSLFDEDSQGQEDEDEEDDNIIIMMDCSDEEVGVGKKRSSADNKTTQGRQNVGAMLTMDTVDDGIVAENTGKAYIGEITAFLNWCLIHHELNWLSEYGKNKLLSLQVKEGNAAESPRMHKSRIRNSLKSLLRDCTMQPIVNIDVITPRGFMEYLLTLRHSSTGGYLSKSSYGNKRAALFHLFCLHNGMGYRDGFRLELSNLFKGFYRNIVKIRHEKKREYRAPPATSQVDQTRNNTNTTMEADKQGEESMIHENWQQQRKEGGKEPMSVELYMQICGWLLEYGTIDGVWAHLFLILSWNLGCRSNNTATIKMSDISWATSFDSFEICFAHSKTDQVGEEARYPRHIYANPHSPIACPVLAIALYFCCCFNVEQTEDCKLFPGSRQCTRFSNILSRVLHDHKENVNELGYQLDDIGTHSIRKGAFSFLASLNGGPPSAAICIRGGWSMGKVRDIYMRYISSGDEFVGRCLALLPLMSSDFASSPPFFSFTTIGSDEKDYLQRWIEHSRVKEFPMLKSIFGFGRLTLMALASFLYHRKWILSTLTSNDVILIASASMRSNEVEEMFASRSLSDLIKVTYPCWNDCEHVFAGVPPSVSLLQQLSVLQCGQMEMIDGFVDKVKVALNEFGVNADRLTLHEFRAILDNFRSEMRGEMMISQRQQEEQLRAATGDQQSSETIENDCNYKMHCYGGLMHRVPVDWRFPRCGVHDLWRQWWIGDKVRQVFPLRFLQTIDVKHLDNVELSDHEMHGRSGRCINQRRKAKKTLCDMKFLMNLILQKVEDCGALETVITMSAVDRMYFAVADLLLTDTHGENRDAQKHWPTFVRIARKNAATRRKKEGEMMR